MNFKDVILNSTVIPYLIRNLYNKFLWIPIFIGMTLTVSLFPSPVSALVLAPPPPPASCSTPGEACGECVAQRCSGGDQCATGHTYCVFDPSGNFCGECQREVDNCAVQCLTPVGPFSVGPDAAGLTQIEQLFINVVFVTVALGFIAMFAFLVWAGFKYLTSGGEPKAVHAAHQTVTWALLGVIFLAIAWLVLQLISAFTGINLTIFNIRTLFP